MRTLHEELDALNKQMQEMTKRRAQLELIVGCSVCARHVRNNPVPDTHISTHEDMHRIALAGPPLKPRGVFDGASDDAILMAYARAHE